MIRIITVGICGFIIGFFAFSFLLIPSSCDEDIYSQFVTIEGNVKIIEPETGKVFTPVGQNLIFQRVDCKKCLSVAITDENGNYQLRVGGGKYRLIVREDLSKGGSFLDPNQPEIVDARNKVTRNVFDVRLVRHKNPLDITLQPPETILSK